MTTISLVTEKPWVNIADQLVSEQNCPANFVRDHVKQYVHSCLPHFLSIFHAFFEGIQFHPWDSGFVDVVRYYFSVQSISLKTVVLLHAIDIGFSCKQLSF